MNMADEIKRTLTMQQVSEHYGFPVSRSGFIKCPFHRGDRTASLKIYNGNGGFHCFGCGAHGSVIDFVMKLYGLDFRQAAIRISSDFHLGLTNRRHTKEEESKIIARRRTEETEQERKREEYYGIAHEHRYWLEVKKCFSPNTYEGKVFIHPLYAEAVQRLPYLEWWLDEHLMTEGDRNK